MNDDIATDPVKDAWTTPRVEAIDAGETRVNPGFGVDGFFFFLSAS